MNEASSQRAVSGYNAATGTSNAGFDKFSTKYSGNQHTKTNPDALINKGRGPTGGGTKMPSCDMELVRGASNPQKRQAVSDGATRAFDPSATQNYKGNADKINVGRGPTKGNQR
jgi:hypothetical protein